MPSSIDWAPPRFEGRTLDGFETRTPASGKALAAARRFAAGEIRSLVLAGPTGIGKTHLAVAASTERWCHETAVHDASEKHLGVVAINAKKMAWEPWRYCRDNPLEPMHINVPELMIDIRSEMGCTGHRRTTELADDLRSRKGVVLLDDLGREKVSDWTGEVVYAIVNRRYEELLPTIVTTNLTSAELAASPYWPVISRLAEDGELVRLDGNDFRLQRRAT